jgi:hypothetical protein
MVKQTGVINLIDNPWWDSLREDWDWAGSSQLITWWSLANWDLSIAAWTNNIVNWNNSVSIWWSNNTVEDDSSWVFGSTGSTVDWGGLYNYVIGWTTNDIADAANDWTFNMILNGDRENIINWNRNFSFGWSQNNFYTGNNNYVFWNVWSSFYGTNSVVFPWNHQTRATSTFIQWNAWLWFETGQRVLAKSSFSPAFFWINQKSENIFGQTTTSATPVNITTPNDFYIFEDQVRWFNLRVVAVQHSWAAWAIGDASMRKIEGLLKRIGNIISFVGVPTITLVNQDAWAAVWSIALSVGNISTRYGVYIEATGEDDKTIRRSVDTDTLDIWFDSFQP